MDDHVTCPTCGGTGRLRVPPVVRRLEDLAAPELWEGEDVDEFLAAARPGLAEGTPDAPGRDR